MNLESLLIKNSIECPIVLHKNLQKMELEEKKLQVFCVEEQKNLQLLI